MVSVVLPGGTRNVKVCPVTTHNIERNLMQSKHFMNPGFCSFTDNKASAFVHIENVKSIFSPVPGALLPTSWDCRMKSTKVATINTDTITAMNPEKPQNAESFSTGSLEQNAAQAVNGINGSLLNSVGRSSGVQDSDIHVALLKNAALGVKPPPPPIEHDEF